MNITEKATELAHEKTEKYCEENNIEFIIGSEECTVYTDEAQKIFADFYDNIYSILQTKQILTKLEEVVQDITDLGKSRVLSLAITNAEQARMWLEKHFRELVEANPYPREDTSIQIDPITDTYVSLGKVDYVELPNPQDSNFYYVVNGLKYRYLGENSKGLNLAISDDSKELLTLKEGDVIDKLVFTTTLPVFFDAFKTQSNE